MDIGESDRIQLPGGKLVKGLVLHKAVDNEITSLMPHTQRDLFTGNRDKAEL